MLILNITYINVAAHNEATCKLSLRSVQQTECSEEMKLPIFTNAIAFELGDALLNMTHKYHIISFIFLP